jgi:hypothetical protein
MTPAAFALAAWFAASAAEWPDIRTALALCDASTDHTRIASLLDGLRSLGSRAAPAGDLLSAMLNHRHPIYVERDKFVVTRLRTHLFLTLSEIGTPDSAVMPLLDVLAYFDVRMNPAEAGAAVRAAGALEARGRRFAQYLLAMLDEPVSTQEFSLARYEPTFDRRDATTLQIEVVRSLGRISTRSDAEVLRRLRDLASASVQRGADRRVAQEARASIEKIEGVGR